MWICIKKINIIIINNLKNQNDEKVFWNGVCSQCAFVGRMQQWERRDFE